MSTTLDSAILKGSNISELSQSTSSSSRHKSDLEQCQRRQLVLSHREISRSAPRWIQERVLHEGTASSHNVLSLLLTPVWQRRWCSNHVQRRIRISNHFIDAGITPRNLQGSSWSLSNCNRPRYALFRRPFLPLYIP
jgi:hypothetical protein